MALLHIPLDQIDREQLQRLIDAQAAEARDIEYKRATYGNADADHAEFLADVSSFANTAGGDLIIGMEAAQGVPTAFSPFTGDADAEINRLDQMALSSLQPRIPHLHMRAVSLSQGGAAIVIRIPRSYNPPHRLIKKGKGNNRFFARSSAGKYEPNVDELRALFTLAPQLADRIRDFRVDRVAKIAAGQAPVALLDRPYLVIHVAPFSSFNVGAVVSLEEVQQKAAALPPPGGRAVDYRVNFDGMLMLSNADPAATFQRAYVQVFRSGVIEAATSSLLRGKKPRLTSLNLEGTILLPAVPYLTALQSLGVDPPYALLVSLVGVKGVQMVSGVDTWSRDDPEVILDRDQFHFAEVIIESIPRSVQGLAVMVRPLLDQIANVAGLLRSPGFAPDGTYQQLFQ
jgi:hypothetical protein